MDKFVLSRFASCALLTVVVGSVNLAYAEEEVEEVTVIGTRSLERSAFDLAVPVDILDSSEFLRQGEDRMDYMLARLVPSFNVSLNPINDAATFVRPVSMRGLSPDSTLVLVNGKRRHRSSIITLLGNGGSAGSHATDLSSIPAIALDRVEVLRDGAAAQYGSDAVAGILNFVLKDASEGGSLEARWGQYYESDGESVTVSGNIGLPLTDRGFLNISGEYNESDPTSRSVQRRDAQALIDAGNMHIREPYAQIWGSPDISDNYKLFVNAGIEFSDAHEFYTFGSYAERTVEGGFFFRNPHERSGIFAHPSFVPFSSQTPMQTLVVDQTPWVARGIQPGQPTLCPEINIENGLVNQAELQAVNAREDCFSFNQVFPGGFTPQFGGDIEDASFALGFRGEISDGLTYDFSAVFGRHETMFYMENTINPQLASLEGDIPREYNPGGYEETDKTFNLDFTKQFDIEGFHSPLNVGFGAEYREEEYEIISGDENSWFIDYYDVTTQSDFDESTGLDLATMTCEEYQGFLARISEGSLAARYPDLGVGSNGFPGFRPDPCGSNKDDRSSVAAYVDFEADVREDLLIGLAVRHEDPEEFDSTLDGKVSARFQATDTLAVRGSLGTGFRVPTVGQANYRGVSTNLSALGALEDELTVPPTDPLLQGIASELEAEESVNATFGLVFNVGALDVTVDYYHIEVKDRISLTEAANLNCLLLRREGDTEPCDDSNEDADENPILEDDSTFGPRAAVVTAAKDALRPQVPAIDSITEVRWFANDFDTTTQGIDLVATYPADWFGGSTQFTFAANWTQTDLDKFNPDNIGEEIKIELEESAPKVRWSLTADHQDGPWRILGRLRYYSETAHYYFGSIQYADAKHLMDLEVAYNFTDQFAFVVGADNLFDTEPSKSDFSGDAGAEFPENIPFDYNGGFYYAKVVLNF